ncbi:MAG: ABC transporter ATP-binding protein [Candidatus Eremiobacteraeota bacterium]|nr:ABC transporter ATP-binding protein [Candidatus Eremiobacteraeota bacterium]
MIAALRAADLSVRYGPKTVFSDVTFELEAGSFTGLVGPNGAGKSSLLRVLAGVQKPASGNTRRSGSAVLIDASGAPPGDLTAHELAGYGMAIRRPWWRFRATEQESAITQAALVQTGLAARGHDAIETLSAGEAQRAWIAAGLATQPAILLIDEPTAHLDLRYQLEVVQTLRQLARSGVAVLAAIHDITLAARCCDAIALLADGALVCGPSASVLEPARLSRAFGVGVATYRLPDDDSIVCVPVL